MLRTRPIVSGPFSAYRGFDYQVDATVWLALDNILAHRRTDFVTIEPASGEDVSLDGEDPEAIEAWAKSGLVQVQIKLRASPWMPSALAEILDTAIAHLRADSKSRYVLLTSAQLHGALGDFVVQTIDEQSAAAALPGRLRNEPDAASLARRISVLEQRVTGYLRRQIDALLAVHGKVPLARREQCLKALRDSVWSRLGTTKELDRQLNREELEYILAAHEGLPRPRGPFVAPRSYARLQEILETKHVLVIVGEAGVGKTRVAEELNYEHRNRPEPFSVVPIDAGISKIREELDAPGPTLIYLEDPWGFDRLNGEFGLWLSELPSLFTRANRDKRFLITSRRNILADATAAAKRNLPRDPLASAIFSFGQEEYDASARVKLLDLVLEPEPSILLSELDRRRIVRKLGRPISYAAFGAELRKTNPEHFELDAAIERADAEAMADVIASSIGASSNEEKQAAAVLWAMGTARNELTIPRLEDLRVELRSLQAPFVGDPKRLVQRLEKAGWCSEHEGLVQLHPITLSGLIAGLEDDRALVEDVLHLLLACTKTVDEASRRRIAFAAFDHQLWIRDVDVSILEARLAESVGRLARATVEGELAGATFEQALRELARIARHRPPREGLTLLVSALEAERQVGRIRFDYWTPPTWTEEQWALVQNTKDTGAVVRAYILAVLPEDHRFSAPELLAFLARLGESCVEEFRELIRRGHGLTAKNVEVIVEGALQEPNAPFDEVIEIGKQQLREIKEWWETEGRAEVHRANQEEIDEGLGRHLQDEPAERFYEGRQVLEAAVRIRCLREGWSWLISASKSDPLLFDVVDDIFRHRAALVRGLTNETFAAILDDCPEEYRLPLLLVFAEHCTTVQLPLMLRALEQLKTDDWPPILRQLMSGDRKEPAGIQDWLKECLPRLDAGSQLVLADELSSTEHLAAPERDALGAIAAKQRAALSPEVSGVLESLLSRTPTAFSAAALAVMPAPSQAAERFLNADDYTARIAAIEALRDLPGHRERLITALADRDYRVRKLAVEHLAPDANLEESRRIIELARDSSAPVREAVAELIGEKCWAHGLDALQQLLRDRRDQSDGYGGERDHHVARTAARSLAAFADTELLAVLAIASEFLRAGKGANDDIGVHAQLVPLLSRGDASAEELLVELLRSSWMWESYRGSSLPLRYRAARALRARSLTVDYSAETKEALLEAARSRDGRIAGPALTAVGHDAHPDLSAIAAVARAAISDERRFLLATGALLRKNGAYGAAWSGGSDHSPARRLLESILTHRVTSKEELDARVGSLGIAAWTSAVEDERDVMDAVRLVLLLFTKINDHPLTRHSEGSRDFR